MQVNPRIRRLNEFAVIGLSCITSENGRIISPCFDKSAFTSVNRESVPENLVFASPENSKERSVSGNFTEELLEKYGKALTGKPVSALWDLLSKYEDKVQGRIKNGVSYGVEFGFDKASGLSCYIAGFPVKEESTPQECFAKVKIPAQMYAVFPCTLNTLREVYDYIYKEWLPNSSFQRTSGAEFELYDANFQADNPNSIFHLYIPIRKKF